MNYLGNKTKLNDFIFTSVTDFILKNNDKIENNLIFADLFAGTGAVSKFWAEKGFFIIANDIQFYSFVVLKAHLSGQIRPKTSEYIKNILNNKNNILTGFITKNYSPFFKNQRKFFTVKNAKRIDFIRNEIDRMFSNKKINKNEYYALLKILLDSVAKVSNTAVVYEAYLKQYKNSALKDIELMPFEPYKVKYSSKIYNEDILKLVKKVSGNILYLDPPYNRRGYDTNYHMFETIALNDNPKIVNMSGRRKEQNKKSLFAMKTTAYEAMKTLLFEAKFKYIFLSYNSEGFIKEQELINFCNNNNWLLKIYKKKYKRFKSNNNKGPQYIDEIMYAIKK